MERAAEGSSGMTEQAEVFHPKIIREDEPEVFHPTILEDDQGEDEEGRVEIRLPNGKILTMKRDDKELLLCASNTCVGIPATGATALAIYDFFKEIADEQ